MAERDRTDIPVLLGIEIDRVLAVPATAGSEETITRA
jgi:hypothetical protein